jgi:hypothetical protein
MLRVDGRDPPKLLTMDASRQKLGWGPACAGVTWKEGPERVRRSDPLSPLFTGRGDSPVMTNILPLTSRIPQDVPSHTPAIRHLQYLVRSPRSVGLFRLRRRHSY